MDDIDLIIDELGEEESEKKYWMCEECNLDDIKIDETKCPRCGHKHKHHHARSEDIEYDESGEEIDSQIAASTMLAQALRLYKTILAPEEFDAMIRVMVETANSIEPYKTGNLH